MDDMVSRQTAIDAVCMEWCNVKHQDCKHPFDVEKDDYYWCDGCETALRTLPDLPSAQQDCTECEDYDTERHSCPKYCDVIRKTVEEAKQERTGRWIDDNCSECGQYVYHGDVRNFCPNCGARMEGTE